MCFEYAALVCLGSKSLDAKVGHPFIRSHHCINNVFWKSIVLLVDEFGLIGLIISHASFINVQLYCSHNTLTVSQPVKACHSELVVW